MRKVTAASGENGPHVSIGGVSDSTPRPSYYDIKVRTGSGATFTLSVHNGQKVNDVHKQISKLHSDGECPLYAIRLIHRSKVLSMHGDALLGTFDIADGDTMQLVVVSRQKSRT